QQHFLFGVCLPGLVAVDVLHAHGAVAAEQQTPGECTAFDGQVGAAHGRAQVGHGRAPAAAFVHGHIHGTDTFLLVAVHVLSIGVARLLGGIHEGAVQRVFTSAGADVQRPGITTVVITAEVACLGLAEIGQDVLIAPVIAAGFARPAVLVQRVAADVGHAVDRRRAAQHTPARAVDAAAVEMRFRFAYVIPVVAFALQRVGQRRRHVDEDAAIAGPGLQQQDVDAAVFSQPVGQY